MKIKFLATSQQGQYSINDEVLTVDGEPIDLSEFPEGGKFEGVEGDEKKIVRNIERVDGELHVTICQSPPITKVTYKTKEGLIHATPEDPEPDEYEKKIEHRGGHWTESDWIDAEDYDPDTLYIQEVQK